MLWSKIAKTPTKLGSITDAMVENRENFQQSGAQSPNLWSKIAKTSNKVGLNHRSHGRKSRKLPTNLGSITDAMVDNRENFQQNGAQLPIPWSKIVKTSNKIVLNHRSLGRKSRKFPKKLSSITDAMVENRENSNKVGLNHRCYGRKSRKFPTEWCSTTDAMVENRENFRQSGAQRPMLWSNIEKISDRVVLNDRSHVRSNTVKKSDEVLNHWSYGRWFVINCTKLCTSTNPVLDSCEQSALMHALLPTHGPIVSFNSVSDGSAAAL